ncbi:MAG TPA: hypothetical protein PLK34_02035 [Candidatus Pacearchaeota archaeon]|nr:hypothetical protein [Candidatus Pacearchaeota archaeon]
MKIVGLTFKKISIEKLSDKTENLKVETKIDLSEISQVKADLFKTKDDFLGVKFSYIINYNPNYVKIEFKGDLLVSLDQRQSREILKQWKEKKIEEDFKIFVFNAILRKANLKAMELEDEMNLPLHIPLPAIRKESKEKK